MLRTEARFPDVDPGAGHYESFYIKASRPGRGGAVWLRHTVHKRPDEEPKASLWLTIFDADAPGPRAVKSTVGADQLAAPGGAYIKVGDAVLEPGRANGRLETGGVSAEWDLRNNTYEASINEDAAYSCTMTVLQSKQQFRPARSTPTAPRSASRCR